MPVPSLRHATILLGAMAAACAATYNLAELLSPRPAAVRCLEDEVLRFGKCISIVEDHKRVWEAETIELKPECFADPAELKFDGACPYLNIEEDGHEFWLNLIPEEAAGTNRITLEELELMVTHLSEEASIDSDEQIPAPGTCIHFSGSGDIYCRLFAAD